MPEFDVIEVREQPTAVVRASVPMAELKSLFDRAFGEVFQAIGEQGIPPTGAPFGYYLSQPTDEKVSVEAGIPVAGTVAPTGDVVASGLPGGRVVHCLHVGPYEQLEQTYHALLAWTQEQGLTLGAGMWECYLTDPVAEPDPQRWRTEVFWQLAD